jgi:transcriptional regulator with XRE-family HTH domain
MKIDANRVRQLRHQRHWSQEELAEACAVNLRTIQRLENEGRASRESLRALASVFEVAPESLLHEEAAPAVTPSALLAMRTELLRFHDFAGRSNRHDYWWFLLACLLALAIGQVLHPMILAVLSLVLVVPILAAGTRRLRDAGESPWWQLFWLVPIAGLVVLWLQTRPSLVETPPEAHATG